MTPDSNLRIQSMIRSVTEVIIPALDANDSLAQEQVKLLMGHLNALLVQAGREPTVKDIETKHLFRLAEILIEVASDEKVSEKLIKGLSESLKAGDRFLLSLAIENLISSTDTSENFKQQSWNIVLEFGSNAANRGKKWFEPMGF